MNDASLKDGLQHCKCPVELYGHLPRSDDEYPIKHPAAHLARGAF